MDIGEVGSKSEQASLTEKHPLANVTFRQATRKKE
jgi:hypothetical protein